jgi:hypothetical protein
MRRFVAIAVILLITGFALGETATPVTEVKLRAAPKTRRSPVLAILSPVNRLEILETRKGWYRVRVVTTAVEGWVARKYVRLVQDTPAPSDPAAGDAARQTDGTGGMVTLASLLLAALVYAAWNRWAGPETPSPLHSVLSAGLLSFAIGAVYVALTLPKAMMAIAAQRGWPLLAQIGASGTIGNRLLGDLFPAFPDVMSYLFWATLLYLVSLATLALRHGQGDLFTWGAGTLLLSTALFHVLAWAGYVVTMIFMFLGWMLSGIFGFLWRVAAAVLLFLAEIIVEFAEWIYALLLRLPAAFWWFLVIVVIVSAAGALIRFRGDAGALLKFALAVLLVGAVAWAARWVWQFVGPWVLAVLKFLGSIVAFLAGLVLRLLAAVAIVLAVATIGQLLLDQIHGALSAGRRRGGVIIGAMAVGVSIAILLFVSNLYGATSWLPAAVMEVADQYLHQPAPLLDGLIALVMVGLSVVGIWRNVRVLGVEPSSREFGQSLVYAAVGVFVTGALVAVATQTEQ